MILVRDSHKMLNSAQKEVLINITLFLVQASTATQLLYSHFYILKHITNKIGGQNYIPTLYF